MSVDVDYEYFKQLSSMLPKIITQDYDGQSISTKYQHNPSGKKKRKMKMNTEKDENEDNPKSKKQKVISVKDVPSLEHNELKSRLNAKIEQARITRKHSIEKAQKLKEKRKLNNNPKKTEPKHKTPTLKVGKESVAAEKPKQKPESVTSIQFSKFESKTKAETDLESSKIQKRKKKNLSKMLDDAKKMKKENMTLQKATDDKSVSSLQDKAWKKALSMAKGEKQKDNPDLIIKSIKRKEQKKKKSKKEWNERVGGQKKLQKQNQKKRQANIEKRIQSKKQKR